jgi:NTE family protein
MKTIRKQMSVGGYTARFNFKPSLKEIPKSFRYPALQHFSQLAGAPQTAFYRAFTSHRTVRFVISNREFLLFSRKFHRFLFAFRSPDSPACQSAPICENLRPDLVVASLHRVSGEILSLLLLLTWLLVLIAPLPTKLEEFMPKCRLVFVLLLLLLAFPLTTPAQLAPNPEPRKKIGLVLEGGGALGLAHVGIIEWLEENHIPVDYIAGTSMGGLIGGMYAMGYSPKEIRDTVALIDWDAVLYDRIDYSDLAFRRKQDRRTYPNTLAFSLRKGFRLPEGINAGHRVGLILDNLTRDYSTIQSFDDLPVPFRCVSVELSITSAEVLGDKYGNALGRETVFKKGSLSQALRSTMSIPGFFSPVRAGKSTLYIDGGVLDNLPVQVVLDMGADIVIAVHLDRASFDPGKDISLLDVAFRSIAVVIASNERSSLARLDKERGDVAITVPLSVFRGGDYDKREPLRLEGYQAAEENRKKLMMLSLQPEEWDRYRVAKDQKDLRKMARVPVKPVSQKILTEDAKLEGEIQHSLSDYRNRPFDEKQIQHLEQELNRIVGTERFSSVGFRMAQHEGKPELLITANKRDSSADLVPVVAIDGSDYRSPTFTVGARTTVFDLGAVGAEWRTDALLGSQYGLVSEYYRPLRSFSSWFVAPQIKAETLPFDIYNGSTYVAAYRRRTLSGSFDLGYNFGRNAQLSIGYEGGAIKLSHTIGAPLFGFSSGRLGTTTARFSFDRLKFSLHKLEAPVVPRDGLEVVSTFQWHDSWLGSSHRFPSLEAGVTAFKSVNHAGSVYLQTSAGSLLGFANEGLPLFSLGSPLRLAAYGTNQFLVNQYIYGRTGYIHRVYASDSLLGGGIYVTGSYELAKAYGVAGVPSLPTDATAGIILDYAVGPLFLGGSIGENGNRKLFFYLGRLF